MTTADYTYFLEVARRHTRVQNEAEDLLQNALIVAIKNARADLSIENNRKWLAGVIRNQALQDARTAVRRKERDAQYIANDQPDYVPADITHAADPSETHNRILDRLPPAARKVAVLALYGMDRKEICTLLSISPTAFRQRLTSIRKVLAPLSSELRRDLLALAYARRQSRSAGKSDLPIGMIRNALMSQLQLEQQQGRKALGTHDPTGHPIVISRS